MRAAKVAILAVCLWAGDGTVSAVHAAGPHRGASRGPNKNEAEGRRHARKANQLADVNKCKAAIPEYTKAIRLLKDPTLLFNRAECYRRTGEARRRSPTIASSWCSSRPRRIADRSRTRSRRSKRNRPAPS